MEQEVVILKRGYNLGLQEKKKIKRKIEGNF